MSAAAERLRAALAALDDRLNPVLVLEVRRALRSRVFVFAFVGALDVAVVAAFAWATGSFGAADGSSLLLMTLGILALCNLGIVPFHAFQSMAGELDGETIEPLSLAVPARRVLLGKLGAALVLALLFVCAVLPFAAVATLAGGVDLVRAGTALVDQLALTAAVAAAALWMAASGAGRSGRAGQLAALAIVVLVVLRASAAGLAVAAGGAPGASQVGLRWRLVALVLFGGLALLAAAARIAHPHENTTTPLRAWASLGFVALLVFMGTNLAGVAVHPVEVLGPALAGTFGLWLAAVVFATEPDGSLWWFRRSLPRGRAAALLAAPWMPGGSRALLWLGLHLLVLVLAFAGLEWGAWSSSIYLPVENAWSVAAIATVAWSTVAIFSSLGRRDLHRPRMRARARLTIVLGTALLLGLPSLVPFLVSGERALGFVVLTQPVVSTGGPWPPGEYWLAWAVLALAIAVATPRIVASLREVAAVRSAERGRGGPAPPSG